LDVYKSKDKNSCPSGTKIFSPRTRADWKTFLTSATPLRNPHWIIDVTRPQNGCGGCTGHVMNSGVAAQATWGTSDGSPWWLRSTSYSQPNGDYLANCYLDLWHKPANENSVTFDDGNCNFHARSYYCQSLKTTTTTTTTPKAQYFGGSKLLTASNQARLFAWGVPNGDWTLCYRKTSTWRCRHNVPQSLQWQGRTRHRHEALHRKDHWRIPLQVYAQQQPIHSGWYEFLLVLPHE